MAVNRGRVPGPITDSGEPECGGGPGLVEPQPLPSTCTVPPGEVNGALNWSRLRPSCPKEAGMTTLAEACGPAVAFTYRSIDRLILNAYIPTLQMPGAMVTFLREVCGKPILSPVVFKALTDRFVAAVHAFTDKHGIPVLHATGRTRPGEVAQRALRTAARANRWGVVAVVVHQESARVFTSRHAGGRRTNFWVREERRLVNHYYFYLRDREYGDGFVRISSYAPFQTRIWLNAHGYLAAQLRQRRIKFRTLDNCVVEVADPAALRDIAEHFDAA